MNVTLALPGPATLGALALIGLLVTSGCDGETQSLGSGEGVGGACSDFQPGTNMLAQGYDPGLQAIGDMAVVSQVVLGELAGSCEELARALGESPSAWSEPPTREEVSTACSLALGAAQRVKQERALTFTAEPTSCDVAGAEATSRATCSGESTCDAFCASSALGRAECPPAPVVVSVGGVVPEEPDAELVALARGLGRILGVYARVSRVFEVTGSLTGDLNDFAGGLESSCIPEVVEVLADAVLLVETATTIGAGAGQLLEEPTAG